MRAPTIASWLYGGYAAVLVILLASGGATAVTMRQLDARSDGLASAVGLQNAAADYALVAERWAAAAAAGDGKLAAEREPLADSALRWLRDQSPDRALLSSAEAAHEMLRAAASRSPRDRAAVEAGRAALAAALDQMRGRTLNALDESLERMSASIAGMKETALAVTAAGLALGALLALFSARAIRRPLSAIAGATTALAGGSFGGPVPHGDRRDEIGAIARAVGVFRTAMAQVQELKAAEALARAGADSARKAMLSTLADDIERSILSAAESVERAGSSLKGDAASLAETARLAAAETAALSATAAAAGQSSEQTAGGVAELERQLAAVEERVRGSFALAEEAARQAERTDRTVSSLTEMASRVGDVVKLISEIAAQTNLLALNATIEAARAGEAGRGFAVVAGEVKGLAAQTARATDEIARQIAGIQQTAGGAAEAIRAIAATIERLHVAGRESTSSMSAQRAAATAIAGHAAEALVAAQGVRRAADTLTTATATTGAAAQKSRLAAEQLSGQANGLEAAVSRFVGQLRAS
ncbi:MAG: HAMP domain-containing protein [Alphaproteobacteria bacterium]|nr:HAMP domain-containing protein [Alphaproteobacteria bacterium]